MNARDWRLIKKWAKYWLGDCYVILYRNAWQTCRKNSVIIRFSPHTQILHKSCRSLSRIEKKKNRSRIRAPSHQPRTPHTSSPENMAILRENSHWAIRSEKFASYCASGLHYVVFRCRAGQIIYVHRARGVYSGGATYIFCAVGNREREAVESAFQVRRREYSWCTTTGVFRIFAGFASHGRL